MILYYTTIQDGETSAGLLERALLAYCKDTGKKIPRKKNRVPAKGKNGKPYYPVLSSVFFSVSHTDSFWICAFDRHPVGVDAERADRKTKGQSIADRFFTEAERSHLEKCACDEKEFLRLWTRKEAYVKYTGEGIARGLDTFSVLEDRLPGIFETEGEVKLPEWVFLQEVVLPTDACDAPIICTACGVLSEMKVMPLPEKSPEDALEEAKSIAFAYLETRPRTEKEMTEKLREKGVEPQTASQVLELLKDYKFIDDAAYAEHYAEMAKAKGRGPIRIRRELQNKGIQSASQFDDAEFQKNATAIAIEIWEKAGSPDIPDAKLEAKILRKLAAQGYTAGMAYAALSAVKKRRCVL